MRYFAVVLLLLLAGCGSGGSGPTGGGGASSGVRSRAEFATVQPTFTVNLRAGWNAVAFQGFPVSALEAGPEVAGFATWNGREYEIRPLTVEELIRLGQPRGLWIYATAATTFRYAADAYVAGVDLTAGWNLASFGTPEAVATADLRASDDGRPMALGEVLLTRFQQINPDNTYTEIDVSSGATLQPGLACWIYASRDVSLEWEGAPPSAASPSASPSPGPGGIPWPSPGLTFPSPSPLAFPSPLAPSPAPIPSPSPAATPAGSPAVTSTPLLLPGLGAVASVSDDGRTVAALQAQSNGMVLQHGDLVTLEVTEDLSASFAGSRGPAAVVSSADGQLDALLIDGLLEDSVATHTRSSNSSSIQSTGLPLYPYAEGLDVSADGHVTAWTETSEAGNQTVVFKAGAAPAVDVRARFPGLGSARFLTRGRGSLSDDGQQLLYADGQNARYVRLDLLTGANVTVFEAGSGAKQAILSGNGQFVLYQRGGAPSLSPVRSMVRDIVSGTDDALALTTRSTFGTAISSDGRFVLFNTEAGLVPEDTNASFDYYLRDRLNRTTVRVTVDERGAEFAGHTTTAVMSRNGHWIVFRDPAGTLRRVRNSFS